MGSMGKCCRMDLEHRTSQQVTINSLFSRNDSSAGTNDPGVDATWRVSIALLALGTSFVSNLCAFQRSQCGSCSLVIPWRPAMLKGLIGLRDHKQSCVSLDVVWHFVCRRSMPRVWERDFRVYSVATKGRDDLERGDKSTFGKELACQAAFIQTVRHAYDLSPVKTPCACVACVLDFRMQSCYRLPHCSRWDPWRCNIRSSSAFSRKACP